MAYVVLSRIITDENFAGEEAKDEIEYLGVNVFENRNGGGVVMDMGSLLIKNSLSNELSYSFMIDVNKDMMSKVINLVVIGDSVANDVYFTVRVISSAKFTLEHST